MKRNIYHAELVLLCTAGTKGTMSQGALSNIIQVSITENVKPVLHCYFFSLLDMPTFCVIRTNCHVGRRKSGSESSIWTLFNFMAFHTWQLWTKEATLSLLKTVMQWHYIRSYWSRKYLETSGTDYQDWINPNLNSDFNSKCTTSVWL